MKRLLVSFILFFLCTLSFAQNNQILISMDSIDVEHASEEYGDELYLVVTRFGSDGSNTQYTIPQYPITWPSEAIHQVKNVKVWSGSVGDNKEEEIIIELVEHDAPPYNVDDSIGSIRIKLNNTKGQISATLDKNWHEKDKESVTENLAANSTISKSYIFKGDGGSYTLKFSLKEEVTQ